LDRSDKTRTEGTSRAWAASMSVALGLGLGFFVLSAVVGVLSVGLVSGYQNTVDLLRQKAELLIASESDLTRQYLEAARNQVDFIADRISSGEIEPSASEEFTSLVMGALAATPQIVMLQFVDESYRLIGAERQEDDWLPLFMSVRGDEDLRLLADKAKQDREAYWGKPVWREDLGEALLNYNRPVTSGGTYLGTVSALVSVTKLSEFISDLETGFGANAFILYGRDWILAHPLMTFGYAGLTRLKPFPEQRVFGDPVISSMWLEREEKFLEERIVTGPGVKFVRFADQGFIVLHRELAGYTDKPLLIGTYFQSSDLLSEALRLKWAVIICFAISVVSAIAAAIIGRQIARPVRRLAEGSKKVYNLDLAAVDPIPGSFFRELDEAANSFNSMLDGLRWFERYVPRTLVQRLIRLHKDEAVESAYREVAILFTDLVKFTQLSEQMTAPAAADFLNGHFTMVADCVEAEGGVIDKYIGDSVMAIWGAPDKIPDLADRACRAALAIAAGVRAFNRDQHEAGGPQIRMRIGVHMGRVVVGNIGSPGRINYTVIGDPVIVAQRLEETGKQLGGGAQDTIILVSGAIRAALMEDYGLEPLGLRKLRGRSEEIEVFALEAASAVGDA
jgi:class 3 adenylate cyclase